LGWYTFVVNKKARKPVIARAVEESFGVNVAEIKTTTFKPETKMQRSKRHPYQVPGYKKAVVKLKEGQKIALFETETGDKEEKSTPEVKEKKSLLKGTKVKIERGGKEKETEVGGERNV